MGATSPKKSRKNLKRRKSYKKKPKDTKLQPGDTFRYKVWLKQAKFDLQAAKTSTKYGFYEWACFQTQQSAEKSLKSIIVSHGKSAPRIHRLGVLFGIIKGLEPKYRGMYLDVSELQAYTFASRYPFLVPGTYETPHEYITKEDATICIRKATKILRLVQNNLKV